MKQLTLHTQIVTGGFTLPVVVVGGSVLWVLAGLSDFFPTLIGLAITLLITFLVRELNNRFFLLRVRSRLMSTTYLFLMVCFPALHVWSVEMLPVLCLVLCYSLLFSSYQQRDATGRVFYAFLLLGIGSLFFPAFILLGITFYVSMLFYLRNLTWRSFVAGILGSLVPYWCYLGYAVWNDRLLQTLQGLQTNFTPHFSLPLGYPWQTYLPLGVLALFLLCAVLHLLRTAYNDKIRVRMFFYTILTQEALIVAGLTALPTEYDALCRLFLLNTSFLLAHYYALIRGRLAGYWFCFTVLALVGVAVFNYLQTN